MDTMFTSGAGHFWFGDARVTTHIIIYVVIYALLLAALFFMFYMIIKSARKNREYVSAREVLTEQVTLNYYKRQKDVDERWRKIGETEKKPFLYNFDRMIDYSGLRQRIPIASADLFIIVFVLVTVACFFIGAFTGMGAFVGLLLGIAICIAVYTAMRFKADINFETIENGMFGFVNAISTSSKGSDDIIAILDDAKQSFCRPLRILAARCCLEARNTGRTVEALHHFELAVENNECKKIIRNLSMCAQTDSDYTVVIDECRVGLKEHIAAREERKSIVANNRATIIQLAVIGALSFFLIGSIVNTQNVFVYLWAFFLGRVVLIYIVAVLFACVIYSFAMKERG